MANTAHTSIRSANGDGRAIGRAEFVVIMAALMSLNALGIDTMLPALDEIAADFSITDPNRRQLVVGAFLIANGVGSILPGAFADRFGRRPVLFVCLALYVVFSLTCAIATSFDLLLFSRVLQGLATACLLYTSDAADE